MSAPEPRLTVERFGHTLTVTRHGLAIDGRTVDPVPLTQADAVRPNQNPRASGAFQVHVSGAVIYRGQHVAQLDPAGTPGRPGPVQINPSLAPAHDLGDGPDFDL